MSRVTVNMPDSLEITLKKVAENKGISVSKIVAEAINYYLYDIKRRKLGNKVLNLIGKSKISANADKELEAGRIEIDNRT